MNDCIVGRGLTFVTGVFMLAIIILADQDLGPPGKRNSYKSAIKSLCGLGMVFQGFLFMLFHI